MKCHRTLKCVPLACVLLSPAAHAGLFGPDIVPLSSAALKEKLHEQRIALEIKAAPLEVKSKGAAVGGFILGFIASSALGSNAGRPRPGSTMQQWAESLQAASKIAMESGGAIASATTSVLNAQNAKSAGTQAKEGPIALLVPQLQAAFMQAYGSRWRSATEEKASQADDAKMRLDVEQSTWMVDFSMTSSDYHLRYSLGMKLTDLAAKAINRSVVCEGIFDKKMSDEDWKKDDFQAVADASKAVSERCLEKFLSELDIARVDIAIDGAATESMIAPDVREAGPTHIVDAEPVKSADDDANRTHQSGKFRWSGFE